MLLLASGLMAFSATAALALLDKRQRKKRERAATPLAQHMWVWAGIVCMVTAAVLAFLEPAYTGWMSLIAFAGIVTIAALFYAVMAAFNMRLAVRMGQACPALAFAIVAAFLAL